MPAPIQVRPFREDDTAAVVALWATVFPSPAPRNEPHGEIRRKLAVQPDLFLVAADGPEIVGTVLAGYDGTRGWIHRLAVAPARRRAGIGRRLMAEAETRLRALGCPKVNLQIAGDNAAVAAFYARLGYTVEDRVSMGKELAPPRRAPAAVPVGSMSDEPVEVIGIDHVYVTVRDLAASERFYDPVMVAVLGFRKSRSTIAGDPHVHYFNRQFGFSLRPARPSTPAHDPYAPGLHHFCFRVEDEAAVDRAAAALGARGVAATPPARYPQYAPDYYATFFTDPDGVRLEITNFRANRRQRMYHWEDG